MTPPTTTGAGREQAAPNVHFDTSYPELSRARRMQIPFIAGGVLGLLKLLGPTLRFEDLGVHHLQEIHARGERAIGTFWHRSIFAATWRFRGGGIVVMNTTNFDGQWTRRVIEKLGYLTAQGSSSRGGLHGLAVMAQRIEEGHDVAFTIDGPRGPRYIAKPGPVMLARRTRQPILCYHVGLERAHTFEKSWDRFQIPLPFSRAVVAMAPPIYVSTDADREASEIKHAEMQAALERCRDMAESWFQISEAERERRRAEWNAQQRS